MMCGGWAKCRSFTFPSLASFHPVFIAHHDADGCLCGKQREGSRGSFGHITLRGDFLMAVNVKE